MVLLHVVVWDTMLLLLLLTPGSASLLRSITTEVSLPPQSSVHIILSEADQFQGHRSGLMENLALVR